MKIDIIFIVIILIIVIHILYSSLKTRRGSQPKNNSITTTNLYVIIDPTVSWERDFILNELLPTDSNIVIPNEDVFTRFSTYNQYVNLTSNCVLLFNSNKQDYYKISSLATMLKPKVIFHLADDKGNREKYERLALLTKLYVRQYNHRNYVSYPNTVHMPLGYKTGMFQNCSSTDNMFKKLYLNRTIVWSFIGDVSKQDRPLLVETLKDISPNIYGSGFPTSSVKYYYEKSIFTPNGKGWQVLDCFRLYEASACGSIAVVVGSKDEIRNNFENENSPPWLFASNWTHAHALMSNLLQKPNLIFETRKKVLKWWKERVKGVRDRVDIALYDS